MSENSTHKIYQFDCFRLEAEARRLWCDDQPLRLSAKAFDVLLYLVERRGAVVEREELLREVWRDQFVEDGNLTVHITALRKTLGDTLGEARFIATVSRRGYCFVARVREIEERAEDAPKPESFANRSLAVLPFRHLSSDDEIEYLADGITESLINSLSKINSLKVFASSTIFRYKQSDRDAAEIGKTLGAKTVLTGSVRQVGEQLLVATELVNAADARQLWGAQYHQPLTDIFRVPEEIALAITETLLPQLSEADKGTLKKRVTPNDEAYRAFLKGLHLNGKRTKESIEKGLRYFKRAVELDADFALGYVWIAQSYRLLNDFSILPQDEALPLVKENLSRAVRLAPDLAEAHTLSGYIKFVHEWDWQAAEQEFRRAVRLDPNSILARYSYANFLKHTRQFEEAWRQLNKALELDPLSPILNQMLGAFLFYEKRYDEAEAHFREQAELHPNLFVNYVFLSACRMMREDFAGSLREIRRAYALEPSLEISALLGAAHARCGDKREAQKILRRLEKSANVPFETFYLYLALGLRERALAFLPRSLERKSIDHILLNIDPRADALRSDAEYAELFRRLKLPSF
ncbi:MAG TPA: winged helix-turn-helix domain-containing protein [Pyrinomonadaceae bacterium]|jgi:TolB-like protein/Tfp pilus assembly protein PilF